MLFFSLKPRPFVQSSDSRTCFFHFFHFVYLEMSLFPSIFVPLPLSLCMESTSYVLSFRMVFFYLVTTVWMFDISSLLCESPINSINQSIPVSRTCWIVSKISTMMVVLSAPVSILKLNPIYLPLPH